MVSSGSGGGSAPPANYHPSTPLSMANFHTSPSGSAHSYSSGGGGGSVGGGHHSSPSVTSTVTSSSSSHQPRPYAKMPADQMQQLTSLTSIPHRSRSPPAKRAATPPRSTGRGPTQTVLPPPTTMSTSSPYMPIFSSAAPSGAIYAPPASNHNPSNTYPGSSGPSAPPGAPPGAPFFSGAPGPMGPHDVKTEPWAMNHHLQQPRSSTPILSSSTPTLSHHQPPVAALTPTPVSPTVAPVGGSGAGGVGGSGGSGGAGSAGSAGGPGSVGSAGGPGSAGGVPGAGGAGAPLPMAMAPGHSNEDGNGMNEEMEEDPPSPPPSIPRGPSPEPRIEDSECHRSKCAM